MLLGVGGGAFGGSGVDGGVHVIGNCSLGGSSKSSVVVGVVTVDSSEISEVIDVNCPRLFRLLDLLRIEVG